MTLMEVLISAFVLSVGLLGLASLLPVGRYNVTEALKADRAGVCGRSALHEIKVRRMLDFSPYAGWSTIPGPGSFAIDPLGMLNSAGNTMGGAIPRYGLPIIATLPLAQYVFMSQDDLQFVNPEDMRPAIANTLRPQPVVSSGVIQPQGNYSWFFTVTPAAADATLPIGEQTHYVVSAVVCNRRDFVSGEIFCNLASASVAFGGGDIVLTSPWPNLKENHWIALCGQEAYGGGTRTICRWYRVTAVAEDGVHVSVTGPDWGSGSSPTTAFTIEKSIVGVYTQAMDLDRDGTWPE
jgi:hypothetical protein